MRKHMIALTLAALSLLSAPAYSLADEFADLLGRLNARATVDLGVFKADAGIEFNIPVPRIETVIKTVGTPGDAYICMEVAKVLKKPPEEVAQVFVKNKGKGWGVIAKEMGIKPGSPEFMALKKGGILTKSKGGKGGPDGNGGGKGAKDEGEKAGKGKGGKGK